MSFVSRVRARIFAVALVIAISIPIVASAAAPGGAAVPPAKRNTVATVVSEGADHVVIRLDFPAVRWTEGGGYVYPTIPGFGTLRKTDQPALPVRIERVAIPAGAEPRLTVLDAQSTETPTGLVGPVQRWIPVLPESQDGVPQNVEDPTIYGANELWPSLEPVRLGSTGALREQPFIEVFLTPVLHRPASRSSVVYRSVTVRVDFGMIALSGAGGEDPDFEGLYDLGLVNARQGRLFRGTGRASRAQAKTEESASASTLTPTSSKYKLTIRKNAIYRMGVSWVTTNAPTLLSRNPSEYRMECLGQLVPITVIDAGTVGTFEGSDYIEFYGQALTWDILSPDEWNSGDYTNDNVYWLYADSTPPGTPGRIQTRASAPIGGYPIPQDFSETIHHEINDRFVGQVPEDPDDQSTPDHWYENPALMASGSPFEGLFNVNTPGVSTTTTTASIKARYLGEKYTNNLHRTTIKVNGTTVSGPYDWNGNVETTQGVDDGPANFPQTTLNTATTAVTVSLPLGRSNGGNPVTIDRIYQNWIEITYGRRFRVDTDDDGDGVITNDQVLTFSVPNVNTQIRITGFSQNLAAIYEITKTIGATPLASPVRLTGAQLTGGAPPYQFDFQFTTDGTLPPGTKRRFAVATITAATNTGEIVPAAVRVDVPSTLRNPAAGVDWLVIANATLMPSSGAWQQLVTRRVTQGLRVANQATGGFVDVEDVYDEFSYGVADPQAIRDFIEYVYDSWPRIDPNVPVRYVLLIGDGSYDYQNAFGYPQSKNLLSPYMRSSQSPILGYLSDETYFSAVSGSETIPVPDVYLGRWPVHSTTETNAVAQKVISYETLPQTAPWQTWQYDTVFVADDEATFESVQENQIANHLQGTSHTYHRVYERQIALANPGWTGAQVAAEVNDRIVRQVNGQVEAGRDIGPGAAVLSYVGHGSWQNWGSGFSFIVNNSASAPPNDDVDDLSNGSPNWKLPFFLIADCLSGAFAATNTTSSTDLTYALADDYLVTANKGTIGIIAPSHLTFSVGHDIVENTFFDEVYGRAKVRNFGRLLASIQSAFAHSGDVAALQSYTLLADPAVNLTIPSPRPPTNITATPGNHQISLNWSHSPDSPANYKIYRAESPSGTYTAIATVSGATTSHISTNLTNCQPYYYAITTLSTAPQFEGAWSGLNEGCGTGGQCLTATPLNPSAPAAPTGVSVVDRENGGTVFVQWSANAPGDDADAYTLHWGTSLSPPYPNSMPVYGTSTLVAGLTNDLTYWFAVSARNCSQGDGPKSAAVPVVPRRIEGIKPPNSVQDLRVTRVGSNARLTWTPPTTNIYGQPLTAPGATLASQEVYSGTTPNFTVDVAHRLQTIACPCTNPTIYNHTNAAIDGQNHYYLVVAIDSAGNRSAIRDELPRGIDQLTLTRVGGNLNFSWPAVTQDFDGGKTIISSYSLYGRPTTPMSRSAISPAFLIQGNITNTTHNIPFPAGSIIYYSVIAVDNRGALSPW